VGRPVLTHSSMAANPTLTLTLTQAWDDGVTVSIAEMQLALGMGELLPTRAFGSFVLTKALVAAQHAALSIAVQHLDDVCGAHAHVKQAIDDMDAGAALERLYELSEVTQALVRFAAGEEAMFPSMAELQVLRGAGSITHTLSDPAAFSRRVCGAYLPRHALELAVMHRCVVPSGQTTSFQVIHGRQRSAMLYTEKMQLANWARAGCPWWSGTTARGGKLSVVVGSPAVYKATERRASLR